MTEDQIHESVIAYLETVKPNAWYFHVPNGSKAAPQYRAKLKRLGLRAGVADILFILPGGKLGAIELKTPKGVTSDAQEEFERVCDIFGVDYRIARSIDDVAEVLGKWNVI